MEFQNITALDIKVGFGEVIIEESISGSTTVDIKGSPDQLKEFKVDSSNDGVRVIQKSSGSSNIHIGNIYQSGNTRVVQGNGMNIIQSNGGINISGFSGNVTINGKKIDLSDFNSDDSSFGNSEPPVIRIKCPKIDCSIELSDIAELTAKSSLADIEIDLSGTAKSDLFMCDNLSANLSGTSSLRATIASGELKADTSGCASLQVYGNQNIASVKASASGTSKIQTSGTVNGTYKASASGMSSVQHSGTINGRTKESASGMARIDL